MNLKYYHAFGLAHILNSEVRHVIWFSSALWLVLTLDQIRRLNVIVSYSSVIVRDLVVISGTDKLKKSSSLFPLFVDAELLS